MFDAQATEDAIQILSDRIVSPKDSPIFVPADGVARKFIYDAIEHLVGQLNRYLHGEDMR